MASIKLISPQLQNNLSQQATRLVIAADKQALFHIPEWAPREEFVGPPRKLTLLLKDKANKTVLKTVNGTTASPVGILIEKKYAGSYSFVLEASIDGSTEKATTTVTAYSAPKIVTANWSKQKDTADQSEINYGHTLYINLATEGLNGDNLTLELYNKKDKKKVIDTVTQLCTNGDAAFEVNTLKCFGSTREIQEVEDFFVQVKSPDGQYITAGGDSKVTNFSIKNKTVIAQTEKPENKTPLKIGKTEISPLPTGAIILEKIAVNTTYDVCNDGINGNSNLSTSWILEEGGDKKYHWLRRRTSQSDIDKPTPLPITLHSNEYFRFTATFKTTLPIKGNIQINVSDSMGKYTFPAQVKTGGAGKDEVFILQFNSDNLPYANLIRYFENFELIFTYSNGENTSIPVGKAQFRYYLTWKKPIVASFDGGFNSSPSMQLIYKGKDQICETLLWLGCSKAGTLATIDNEQAILDKVFAYYASLRVVRSRESSKYLSVDLRNQGLGYWRGASAIQADQAAMERFANRRGLRILLSDGEARCGEWTSFFQHVLLAIGVNVGRTNECTYAVCTHLGILSPGTKIVDPQAQQYYSFTTRNYSSNPFYSYEFAVKDAMQVIENNNLVIKGQSKAQGNDNAQPTFADHIWFYYPAVGKFYDASYGKSLNRTNSKLSNYCTQNLNSIVLLNISGGGQIVTSNIHDYLRASRAVS